jgi:protein gp37
VLIFEPLRIAREHSVEESKIEWCTHTFNAWIGCLKVSPGCVNCYAATNTFTRVQRSKGRELWGPSERHFFGDEHWYEPKRWNAKAVARGARESVFCGSMMDVFERPRNAELCAELDRQRRRLWDLIEFSPGLDWLLLTKRPENAEQCVPSEWWRYGLPHHVRVGTTAEDQARAHERFAHFRRIPARSRFLSCEPLLGPLNLRAQLAHRQCARCFDALDQSQTRCDDECARGATTHFICGGAPQPLIDWVIVGGESGGGARAMQLSWMTSIVQQCAEAGVACFVKQFGARPQNGEGELFRLRLRDRKGGDLAEVPGRWPREFPR